MTVRAFVYRAFDYQSLSRSQCVFLRLPVVPSYGRCVCARVILYRMPDLSEFRSEIQPLQLHFCERENSIHV